MVVPPLGNALKVKRDSRGNVIESRRMASTTEDPSDLITTMAYEPHFSRLRHATGAAPRARAPDAPAVDGALRDTFTSYFYYDHESIESRIANDGAEVGFEVVLTTAIPGFSDIFRELDSGTLQSQPAAGADPSRLADLDGDGHPDCGGNLILTRGPRRRVPINRLPAIPSEIRLDFEGKLITESSFTYNAHGQMTTIVEADGDRHGVLYQGGDWDATTNPTAGFAISSIVDLDALQLTSSVTYDAVGHVLTATNPRGHSSQVIWNDLDLPVKTISAAPFLYEREVYFDGNNNVVQVEIEDKRPTDTDGDGCADHLSTHTTVGTITHKFTFDDLNYAVSSDMDAGSSASPTARIVSSVERDANKNVIRVIKPEGNTSAMVYDERDLCVTTISGANDASISGTTRYAYNANGLLTHVYDDDDSENAAVAYTFDGLDRVVQIRDEIGNVLQIVLDQCGNPVRTYYHGVRYDFQGNAFYDAVLMSTKTEFDESNCPCDKWVTQTDDSSTTTTSQKRSGSSSNKAGPAGTPAAGIFQRRYTALHDATGQTIRSVNSNNAVSSAAFDGAGRMTTSTDALGNSVSIDYDAASNPIRVTSVEVDTDTVSPLADQTFVTEKFYDSLNRCFATVSLGATTGVLAGATGNTVRVAIDSRGLVRGASDANGPVGSTLASSLDNQGPSGASEHGTLPLDPAINAPGNCVSMTYDNLGRPLSTTRRLTSDGVGGSTFVGSIVTEQTWDNNSRLINRTDPDGNTTAYQYDGRDRMTGELFADGTSTMLCYNRVSNLVSRTDQNGTVRSYDYDPAERLIRESITATPAGSAEYQTTFRSYEYDGLNRLVTAQDNDSRVERRYDELGLLRVERVTVGTASRGHENQPLDGPTYETRRTYDGEGSLLSMTYPGTGRVLTTERDALERVTAINRSTGSSPEEIASYTYIGGRVKSASFENDTKVDYSYDALKRVTGITHKKKDDPDIVASFAYGWDRSSHRRYEYRAAAGGRSAEASVYTYDSAYRLTRADHQVPVGTALGLASNVAGPPSITPSSVHDAWVYSEAGNRTSHTRDGTTTTYSRTGTASQRNEYSAIGAVTQTHDDNGNLTGAGGITRRFDEANNLVEDDSGPNPVAYRYDALGRRMAKEIGAARTTYAYDGGSQVLGEFVASGAQDKEFTYGGLDSPILMEDVELKG